MPSKEEMDHSRHGRWRRGWGLGLVTLYLGGVGWWYWMGSPKPVLPLEVRRREALVFLRLAREEVLSKRGEFMNSQLASIAWRQAEAGDLPSASETTRAIVEPGLRGSTWNSLADRQRRAGDRSGSRKSLAAAVETANDVRTTPAMRDSVLSGVVNTLLEDGDIEEAVRHLPAINPLRRISPWCDVARAQAKRGDSAGCRLSLDAATEAMRDTGDSVDQEGRANKIGDWLMLGDTQAAIGDTAGRDRSFASATEATQRLAVSYERVRDLLWIGAAQFRSGDPAGRERSLASALAVARSCPDETQRLSMVASVGAELADSGDMAGALVVMAGVKEESRDDIFGAAASVQAGGKEWREALLTSQKIVSARSRARALLRIASRRETERDPVGGREALARAIRSAREIADADDRDDTLAEAAVAQAQAGDPAGAARTIDNQWDEKHFVVWGAIASARARAGDVAGARRIARRLQPKADTVPWWKDGWDRFLAMIGQPREDVLTVIIGGPTGPPGYWVTATCAIATAQARTGDRQAAIATIQNLPESEGGSDPYYYQVASGLVEDPAPAKAP